MGGDAGLRQFRPPPEPAGSHARRARRRGSGDRTSENGELLAERIPGAELLLLDGAGHLYHSEQAAKRRTRRCSTSSGGTTMAEAHPTRSSGSLRSEQTRGAPGTSRRRTRSATGSPARAGPWWTTPAATGWSRSQAARPSSRRDVVPPRSLRSCRDAPDMDATVHWVCEGWHEDIERAIAAFRAQRGRPVGAVRGGGRDRPRSDDLARGCRRPVVGAGDRLGGRAERGHPAHPRAHRADGRRLGRAHRRRVRAARGGARGSARRRVRTLRDRDPRPAAVRRGARRRRRRDRGLPDGAPTRDAPRSGVLRREVPLVPHGRHRVLVPGQGPRSPGHDRRRRPSRSTSTGCGSRRRRRTALDCRRRTSTGSSTGSATGGICWWIRYRRASGRIAITVDHDHEETGH